MTHLKRQKVPKNWPIRRKGTKYVVRPISQGIPILVILRDMLEMVQNKKEMKKIIHEEQILLNDKIVKDEKNGALLFDTIKIIPLKKDYRITLSEEGKIQLEEIKGEGAGEKIAKIVDKKTLKKKKTQLNLSDGKNFISDVKCNVGDSVLINFKDKKIEKCFKLEEKANVVVFAGKHAGKKAVIEKIKLERKMAKLKVGKESINVLIKQLMVIENE